MKTLFLNRHSELRSGWKVLLFFLVTSTLIFVAAFCLRTVEDFLFAGAEGPGMEEIANVLALSAALLGSYLMTRFINRKPFASVGLWLHSSSLREFLEGFLIGLLMIAFIAAILNSSGYLDIRSGGHSWLGVLSIAGPALVMFAAGAMLEEVIFRGYAFQSLVQGVTVLPAVLLMSGLFAAAHLSNPNATMLGIVNIGLASVWFSIAYLKTRGLWLPFGLHFGWNFSQTTLFSFPTSGIEFAERKLFVVTVSGPDWLTGGAFGPEGGVLATAAVIGCSWYLLKSTRFSPQPGIITLDSVEDLVAQQMEYAKEKT
jgi:membrane protease YdiL (CAAX protease family)